MRVAVLGAGAVGFGTAALLCANGHRPILWSPSGRRTAPLAAGAPLVARGAVDGRFHPDVATDCAAALADAEAVLIAVPGYGHRRVIDAAIPHLHAGQTVLFSSHMSFSALYLQKRLAARGVSVPIVAWGTTVTTGRQPEAGHVWVSHIRTRIDAAVLPHTDAAPALSLCRALFGDRFVLRRGLPAIALSNLNPQNHMAIALCNLTRMEKAQHWGQYAHTTEAVGRLIEALDAERLMIAAALGLEVRSVQEHFRQSFGAEGRTIAEMALWLVGHGSDVDGPATLDSRYVTEDVPFGLWPTVRLAQAAGVSAPLHESGIRIFSALYGRDFAAENDILPELEPLSETVKQAGFDRL